jgi:diacylglycerol kinase (ATP)
VGANKILVIANPVAGGGRARRARPLLEDYLQQHGVRADFVESKSTEDLRAQAGQAVDAGYRTIATLGGDGAFHHLLEATSGRDVTLGFFPAGNGNDIADALGLPKDPIAAAHVFLTASPRPIDVVRAEFRDGSNTIFMGAGGTGLDAEAAQLANSRFRRWPGVTRYLAGALSALRKFRPLAIEADLDTEIGAARWQGGVLLAAVANAPCYGSGFRIAPEATVDDGWLNVLLVEALPWTRVLEALPILLRNGDLRWPEIHRYRVRRVRLASDRPALVHGDGELLGETPVEFRVMPGAVRVIAPAHR